MDITLKKSVFNLTSKINFTFFGSKKQIMLSRIYMHIKDKLHLNDVMKGTH